jgi:hypothetical protein
MILGGSTPCAKGNTTPFQVIFLNWMELDELSNQLIFGVLVFEWYGLLSAAIID